MGVAEFDGEGAEGGVGVGFGQSVHHHRASRRLHAMLQPDLRPNPVLLHGRVQLLERREGLRDELD